MSVEARIAGGDPERRMGGIVADLDAEIGIAAVDVQAVRAVLPGATEGAADRAVVAGTGGGEAAQIGIGKGVGEIVDVDLKREAHGSVVRDGIGAKRVVLEMMGPDLEEEVAIVGEGDGVVALTGLPLALEAVAAEGLAGLGGLTGEAVLDGGAGPGEKEEIVGGGEEFHRRRAQVEIVGAGGIWSVRVVEVAL